MKELNDDERLIEIARLVKEYHAKTQEDEYTDTGDAWEVFDAVHFLATSEHLS